MAFISSPIDPSVSFSPGGNSGIVIDPVTKFPHACWYDEINQALKYAKFNGLIWTKADGTPGTEIVHNPAANVGKEASIDLDSNGLPWISYHDNTNDDVLVAQYNGAAWILNTVFTNTGFSFSGTDIVIDTTTDTGFIAFRNTAANDLFIAIGSGAFWIASSVDNAGAQPGLNPRIDLDSNKNPRIVSNNASGIVRYSSFDGFAWTNIDVRSGVGLLNARDGQAIVIAPNDDTYVTYTDGNNDMWEGVHNGVSWVYDFIVDQHGTRKEIDLDSNVVPFVVYFDNDDQELKIVDKLGGSWNAPITIDTGSKGQGLDFKFASDDTKHISGYGSLDYYVETSVPIFNTAEVRDVTNSTIDLKVETDVNSEGFMVVVPDGATAPSSPEVKNGQAAGGGPPLAADSVLLTGGVENLAGTLVGIGLAASTAFDVYVVAESASGLQASPTFLEATTDDPFSCPVVKFSNEDVTIFLTSVSETELRMPCPPLPAGEYTVTVLNPGHVSNGVPFTIIEDIDPVSGFTQISNHTEIAFGRILHQYKKPHLNAQELKVSTQLPKLIQGFYSTGVQEFEDAAFTTIPKTNINANVGKSLDDIGGIIGQLRNGLPDNEYKIYLLGRVARNSSNGVSDDIYKVWNAFSLAVTTVIEEVFPAGVQIISDTLPPLPASFIPIIKENIDASLGAGISLVGIVIYDPVDAFQFSSSALPEIDAVHGFGDIPANPITGGKLATVL